MQGKERAKMNAMEEFDQQLRLLQDQMARKNQLEARRRSLKKQLAPLEEKERALRSRLYAEQADVDRLNRRSLAALFYAVTGQKAGKLAIEEREAYEAAVRHDTAVRELESVREDLRRTETELCEVSGCERRYAETLEKKKQAVREAGGADAERIERLENELAACMRMKREVEEAIRAGRRAQSIADAILSSLNSAESWGTWDLVGGGLVSDLIKHDRIDNAQEQIELLQVQLRRFTAELSDVKVFADMQVRVDGFLRFADFFFDDLISAWVVLDRVGRSKEQVRQVQQQVQQALSRLGTMLNETERTALRLRGELDALVLG